MHIQDFCWPVSVITIDLYRNIIYDEAKNLQHH